MAGGFWFGKITVWNWVGVNKNWLERNNKKTLEEAGGRTGNWNQTSQRDLRFFMGRQTMKTEFCHG